MIVPQRLDGVWDWLTSSDNTPQDEAVYGNVVAKIDKFANDFSRISKADQYYFPTKPLIRIVGLVEDMFQALRVATYEVAGELRTGYLYKSHREQVEIVSREVERDQQKFRAVLRDPSGKMYLRGMNMPGKPVLVYIPGIRSAILTAMYRIKANFEALNILADKAPIIALVEKIHDVVKVANDFLPDLVVSAVTSVVNLLPGNDAPPPPPPEPPPLLPKSESSPVDWVNVALWAGGVGVVLLLITKRR